MTERMEVEVECPQVLSMHQPQSSCVKCGGSGVATAFVLEGSLTEARLRLADAAIAVIEWGLPEHGDAMYAAYDDYAALRTAREAA